MGAEETSSFQSQIIGAGLGQWHLVAPESSSLHALALCVEVCGGGPRLWREWQEDTPELLSSGSWAAVSLCLSLGRVLPLELLNTKSLNGSKRNLENLRPSFRMGRE